MYGDTYHCLIVAVLDHRLYEAGIMHAFFFFFNHSIPSTHHSAWHIADTQNFLLHDWRQRRRQAGHQIIAAWKRLPIKGVWTKDFQSTALKGISIW